MKYVSVKRYGKRYIDFTDMGGGLAGKTKTQKKRGFATKKEALEWERSVLQAAKADMNMKLAAASYAAGGSIEELEQKITE